MALPRPPNLECEYQTVFESCQEKITKSSELFSYTSTSCGVLAQQLRKLHSAKTFSFWNSILVQYLRTLKTNSCFIVLRKANLYSLLAEVLRRICPCSRLAAIRFWKRLALALLRAWCAATIP